MRRGTVAPPPPSLFGLLFRSQAERVGARLRAAAVAGGVTLGRRFARGHAQACLTGGLAVVAGAAIRAAGALGAADRVDAQLVRAAVAVDPAGGRRARGRGLANPRHAAVGRGAIRVAGARVPGGAAFAQRAVAAVTGAAGHTARAGRGAGRDARGARVTVVVRRAGLRAVADDRDGAGEGRLVAVTARVAVDVAVAGVDPWRISTTVRWMMGAVIVVVLVLYAAGRQRYGKGDRDQGKNILGHGVLLARRTSQDVRHRRRVTIATSVASMKRAHAGSWAFCRFRSA